VVRSGGTLQSADTASAKELMAQARGVQGLVDWTTSRSAGKAPSPRWRRHRFILEGPVRAEENQPQRGRGFTTPPSRPDGQPSRARNATWTRHSAAQRKKKYYN